MALTFEERVDNQRAIEEVYWRHRIWPKENKTPKPTLDDITPDSAIRAKVEDYLKKSNALAELWQRPITPQQLQAEMNRIVKNTRQPEMLRELFAALDNDPRVIAECLARPVLVDRLIHNWYANDERFHGALKQQIESELRGATAQSMHALSGRYSEMEIAKSAGDDSLEGVGRLNLDPSEWNEKIEELKGMFSGSLAIGKLSTLQQDADGFYVVAVLEPENERIKTAVVEWRKKSFDEWWRAQRDHASSEVVETPYLYSLASPPSTSSCTDDTWTATQAPFPARRHFHTAVWTGSEMIVWGGSGYSSYLSSGARYDPATDTWTTTSDTNAPLGRNSP